MLGSWPAGVQRQEQGKGERSRLSGAQGSAGWATGRRGQAARRQPLTLLRRPSAAPALGARTAVTIVTTHTHTQPEIPGKKTKLSILET